MKLFLAKNSETKTALIYKNILLFLFFFSIAVSVGVAAVYFTEYLQWLLAALISIGLIFLAFYRPFYSFLVFIITLPFEAAFVIEAGFTFRSSYFLLIITILGLFFSTRKYFFKSALTIPIFIFLGVTAFSLLMTVFYPPPVVEFSETMEYRGSEMRSVIQLLFLFFFASSYFLTVHFCSDRKRLNTVLKFYIGIATLIAIYGIYQFFAIKFGLPFVDITNAISTRGVGYGVAYYADPALFRSHATFQEPLVFGNYILSVFPLLLVLYLFEFKKSILTKNNFVIKSDIILVSIFALVFLLTKSRGAWLGFIAILPFIFLIISLKQKLKIIAVGIVVLIFFSVLITPFISEKYSNLGEFISARLESEGIIHDVRTVHFPLILDLFKKYPILGIGIGNYGIYAADYFKASVIGGGLSIWVQVLVETGFLGFIVLIWLVVAYYKICIETLRKTKNAFWRPYIFGYMACFTGMMVHYIFSFDRFPLYFWVFLGISMGTVKLIKKEEKTQ